MRAGPDIGAPDLPERSRAPTSRVARASFRVAPPCLRLGNLQEGHGSAVSVPDLPGGGVRRLQRHARTPEVARLRLRQRNTFERSGPGCRRVRSSRRSRARPSGSPRLGLRRRSYAREPGPCHEALSIFPAVARARARSPALASCLRYVPESQDLAMRALDSFGVYERMLEVARLGLHLREQAGRPGPCISRLRSFRRWRAHPRCRPLGPAPARSVQDPGPWRTASSQPDRAPRAPPSGSLRAPRRSPALACTRPLHP